MSRMTETYWMGCGQKVRRYRWLIPALCLAVVSCVGNLLPNRMAIRRQAWDKQRGPVIPHDSFPSDCTLCHEKGTWTKIRADFAYDHERETGVALNGAHAQAQCLRCHNDRGPVALFAKRGCAGCHADMHRGQLGKDCAACHTERNWLPQGQVVQHNRTRFPLVGAHTSVACFQCHPGAQVGNFARAPVQCQACHQEDLKQATNPDHLAAGWITDCQRCHKPTVWGSGGFDHTGITNNCSQCHLAQYNKTTNPTHAALGYPTTCESCHNTASWNGATFNHSGITNGCVTCHLSKYNATTNPNHVALGYPRNCESCHNTTSWKGATFNHGGITSGCATCHLPKYNATTNPNHIASGFPTTCENCHTTTSWRGATFRHTFIISRGPHRFACSECHRTPTNYTVVSCTHCHKHSKTEMDSKHRGISGYTWSSPACVSCHPTGRH